MFLNDNCVFCFSANVKDSNITLNHQDTLSLVVVLVPVDDEL